MPWLILLGIGALGTGAYFATKKKAGDMPLDPALTADQHTAVKTAIQRENNAPILKDMAATLLPDLPMASAALAKRAGEL